jgi:DNA-binding beta-propeller fold protein YncE
MPRTLKSFLVAGLCAALGGCPENAGVSPPLDEFFYPVAAAVSSDGQWLYVVNSDFDLRYNGGTVVSVNLTAVREAATRRVTGNGCRVDDTSEGVSNALRCNASRFILGSATRKLNPFAVDAAIARYPDRERLYVAVRGDGSVTWFDLDAQGGLSCGAGGAGSLCDDAHRVGIDGSASPLGNRLPPDPSALSVDASRGWVVVSHQSSDATLARATLLYDRGSRAGSPATATPVILNAVGNVTARLTGLALIPSADAAARSTWVATSRADSVLNYFQAYPGNTTLQDSLPYLYRSAAVAIPGLGTGSDNRSIAVDPAPGASRLFIAGRSPEALLVLDVDRANPTRVTVRDAIPTAREPSRLLAHYEASLGRTLVYVVNYADRRVSVIDPAEHRILTDITTNRGPHALVRDPNGQFMYVMDFLDNALEVIDLRARTAEGDPNPTWNRRLMTVYAGGGN